MNWVRVAGVSVLALVLLGGIVAVYDVTSGGLARFEVAMFLRNFKEYPNVRNTAFIHATATVPKETVLGTYSKIRHWAVIGNNVSIGDFTHVCRETVIGDNTRVGSYSMISASEYGFKTDPVTIGSNVNIGSKVLVTHGITISDYAVVKYGSVVRKDVPAYAIVEGNPAEVIGWNK